MNKSGVQSARENPDYIAKQRKTAATTIAANDFFAKRPQHKLRNFKALHAEWYANNGKAQNKTTKNIAECSGKTAEDEPDKVAYEIHVVFWNWDLKIWNVLLHSNINEGFFSATGFCISGG